MVFTNKLRDGVRRGRIRCSVRIWQKPHVRAGGRYPMDDGHIAVDSIEEISIKDITYDLAREGGFESVADLLGTAKTRPRPKRVPDPFSLPAAWRMDALNRW